jgi:GNAT superfamily N-acetyltransferase
MKLVPIKEISDSELDYITTQMQPDWQLLSPVEDRLPFKENIKNTLCVSYSVYYPYLVKHENLILGTFTLKEKDMTGLGIITPEDTIWLMDIFVIEKYRGNGTGTYIIDQAKELATKFGYKHIYIQCPNKLSYYFAKHGFTSCYKIGANYGMSMAQVMKYSIPPKKLI